MQICGLTMVNRYIPKTALFREVSGQFNFEYQQAGSYAGEYVCADNELPVMDAIVNSAVLIDNMSISGSIPEMYFVRSIIPPQMVSFQILRIQGSELITTRRMVLSQYHTEKTISAHAIFNRGGDGLKLRILGRLVQIPETIGIETITLNISLATYQIDGREFNEYLRSGEHV